MSPTLKPGKSVLVNRISYLFKSPRKDEIIALKDPRDGKTLIKRISKIENGKYFVLGDNKKESTDSRAFGWVGKKDIIGKMIYNSKVKI